MSFEDSDMYQAILDGDLAALGCSVGGQDVNLRDSSGKSYLHICIELGQKELVEYLAQKVFLGFRDNGGHTALDLAARYRMGDVERQLVRRVAGMQDSDDTGGLLALFRTGWRAWPPVKPQGQCGELTPGHQCQLLILSMQRQVDHIHGAVQGGHLRQLQTLLSDVDGQELVLVADHTGLAPLHKAVLFEWLSGVHFISRRFPAAVNHPDHMGRTPLHYAAAYHEYQDNILYKQLIRAGGDDSIPDIVGNRPADLLMDSRPLSLEAMREEVHARLCRPPKDYGGQLSYEDSRALLYHAQPQAQPHSLRKWRAIASVASFAHNTHRKSRSSTPFEETALYEAIITNDVPATRFLLKHQHDHDPLHHNHIDVSQRNMEGGTLLHVAVSHYVSPPLLSLLLSHVGPAERDQDGLTALDLALGRHRNRGLSRVLVHAVLGLMMGGDVWGLRDLAQDGWQHWPPLLYVDTVLGPHISPPVTHFLHSINHFIAEVRALHVAAMGHEDVEPGLARLLDTEAAVTALDAAGLSLVHVAVIFYNIRLLTRILHRFPLTANLKDSTGRTPLHYAADLDDDEYMYSLLRTANARDDEEDLCGLRPVDYFTAKTRIVTPTIQEAIRNKLQRPSNIVSPWPSCLLSARMESSKVYDVLKGGELITLEGLVAHPDTDLDLRDSEGRSYLHHAVLLGAEPEMLKVLLGFVDVATRDANGNTVLDLIVNESQPDALREAVEEKVKGVVLAGGEDGEKEAMRLLLAGWTHWPLTAQEAKDKSEEAATLLDTLMALKEKVASIHRAVQAGETKEVKGLLDRQLLATAADQSGLPPLHKAVIYQKQEPLNYILTEFPEVLNAKDNMGRTALHYAAALSDEGQLYKVLKEAGADENIADLTGKQPTDYQQQPEALPIADILKRLEDTLPTDQGQQLQTQETTPPATEQSQQSSESPKPAEDTSESSVQTKAKTPSPEPPKPAQVEPVNMYIPNTDRQRAPPPTTVDGRYVAQHLGTALTMALAEIAEKRPWDPIEYLGQWLYKYRQNLDEAEQKTRLLEEIRCEEEQANLEEIARFKRKEEHRRIQEEEQRKRKEEEEARKRREQEELQRQAKEAILAQKPQLPTVTEEEAEDTMYRKRDEKGQTELHVLAAQNGADLVALTNLGYSLADRDANNRTSRDVAEENGLTENVESLDNYVGNLLEQERLDMLGQLVIEGYDKLDDVLQKVSTEGLPSTVTDFVSSIPKLQEQVAAIFKAVNSGVSREVENALERKKLALAKDLHGRSPLHVAILAGYFDIAKNIVDNFPITVKTRDNLNRTPLHYATAVSEEMTDFLKSNGADTNAKDALNHLPAYYKDQKDEIVSLKASLHSLGPGDSQGAASDMPIPEIRASDDTTGQQQQEDNDGANQDEGAVQNTQDEGAVQDTQAAQ